MLGGSWSAYCYNGYIYSNDIQKGFDVLDLRDSRVADAKQVRMDDLQPAVAAVVQRLTTSDSDAPAGTPAGASRV